MESSRIRRFRLPCSFTLTKQKHALHKKGFVPPNVPKLLLQRLVMYSADLRRLQGGERHAMHHKSYKILAEMESTSLAVLRPHTRLCRVGRRRESFLCLRKVLSAVPAKKLPTPLVRQA